MISNSPLGTRGDRPSREEMEKVNRGPQERQTRVLEAPNAPRGPLVHEPKGAFATPKQLGYIKKLAKEANFDDLGLLNLIHELTERDDAVLELLKSHEASKVIERLRWILKV